LDAVPERCGGEFLVDALAAVFIRGVASAFDRAEARPPAEEATLYPIERRPGILAAVGSRAGDLRRNPREARLELVECGLG